jgi:putative NADH-flavin reductase
MKITVFGSTGRTSRHVLVEGIRRGHEITAFTRRADALQSTSTLAAVVEGDARDPHAVREAIADAEAVVAIIAARSRKGPHHVADAARVITAAMLDARVRRIVITSPYPIVGDKPRLPMALLKAIFAAPYADNAAMEQLVSTSDLDWTIARLNRLTDKPARGAVRTSLDLLDKPSSITRADAAATLLDITKDATLAKTAINLAGA